MKLVVMIPAYNEEETIGKVIKEIPGVIEGIDETEVLVTNDGSQDNTVEVAKEAGADKIISFKENKGLAPAFKMGLETALTMGADIIVNTDADFQYNQTLIPDLIEPILGGKADIVLGSRFTGWIEHMPSQKRIGNKIATWVTKIASGYPVTDAQTGFRAFSRDAALHLNVMSDYTYVQETILQAVNNGLVIKEIPVDFRRREGESRLISSVFGYARRAVSVIVMTYRDYKPLKLFSMIGGVVILFGFLTGFKVLVHYLNTGKVTPYLPSAVLTSILLIVGFQIVVFGLIADMIKNQRRVQDEILYLMKKKEFDMVHQKSDKKINHKK
jgi:glycosyltransferase involved in cell wall biosynthesis